MNYFTFKNIDLEKKRSFLFLFFQGLFCFLYFIGNCDFWRNKKVSNTIFYKKKAKKGLLYHAMLEYRKVENENIASLL